MVRIVSLDNCSNWPRIIKCGNVVKVRTGADQFCEKKCPASFEVSLPTDMTRIRYEGTPPQFDAVVTCPLCGKEHHLNTESIPEDVLDKIPLDPRSGIMSHHD